MRLAPLVRQIKKNNSGLSLIELLVAMAVFVIAAASITFIVIDALQATRRGVEETTAVYLNQQGIEAAKSIKNRGWKYLSLGAHGIVSTSGYWDFSGSNNVIDKYTRTVTVSPVQRNVSDDIVTSGGIVDKDTKKVSVQTGWLFSPLRPGNILFETYMTNWRSHPWTQTTQGDFNLGVKTNVVSTSGGEVQLALGAGTDYGNKFVLDSTSAIGSMNTQQTMTSLRFTAQHSKTVSELRIYLQTENGTSPSYRYGLQADAAGLPSGAWLGATQHGYGDFTATTTGWQVITLTEPVTFTSNTVYHLVIKWQSGTTPSSGRYIALRRSSPQTQFITFDNTPDLSSNTLFSTNSGTSWTVQNTQPIYLLGFSDSTYEGNPWISKADIRISGTNFVGEYFTPSSNLTLASISFSVNKSAAGTPAADLSVTLATGAGTVLATGTLVTRGTVTTTYATYTYTFPTPQTVTAGTAYRIYLSSPGTGNPFYRVRQLTATNSSQYLQTTFSGTNAVYTSSANSGTAWTQLSPNDIGGFAFATQGGFQTSGDIISQAFDTGSAGTLLNYLDWTATMPTGSLEFQVRTADTPAHLSAATWIGPDGTSATRFTAAGQDITLSPTGSRYVQWRAYFTGDGSGTPILSDVTVNYE